MLQPGFKPQKKHPLHIFVLSYLSADEHMIGILLGLHRVYGFTSYRGTGCTEPQCHTLTPGWMHGGRWGWGPHTHMQKQAKHCALLKIKLMTVFHVCDVSVTVKCFCLRPELSWVIESLTPSGSGSERHTFSFLGLMCAGTLPVALTLSYCC